MERASLCVERRHELKKKVEVSVVTASNLVASGGALAVARRQATLAGMRGSVQRLWVVV